MSQEGKPGVKYEVVPEKTAMIVVDMQNDFVKPGAPMEVPNARAMVPDLNKLLDACRKKGIPVIYIREVIRGEADAGRLADLLPAVRDGKAVRAGTENVEIYSEIAPKSGDFLVQKPRYSAFYGTDLQGILRTKGIETLIISGTVTNICCASTVCDAFSRDYKVLFLSDGNATFDWPDMGWGPVSAKEAQRVALTVIAFAYGQVASIEEVIEQVG